MLWAPSVLPLHRLALVAAVLAVGACGFEEPERLHTTRPAPAASGSVAVDPRQPLLPTYPCSRCHADRTPDPSERRLTEFHTQKVLQHGTQKGWCYRCHTKEDIDKLHLLDGTLVSFDEAYELCGGCHGDKLRDWRAGIHGLTTGDWNGARVRRSCPACHDPHNPHFPLMTPERAPTPPADRARGAPRRPPRRAMAKVTRSGGDGMEKLVEKRLDERGNRRSFLKIASTALAASAAGCGDGRAHQRGVPPAALHQAHGRGQEAHLRPHRGGDAGAHRRPRPT